MSDWQLVNRGTIEQDVKHEMGSGLEVITDQYIINNSWYVICSLRKIPVITDESDNDRPHLESEGGNDWYLRGVPFRVGGSEMEWQTSYGENNLLFNLLLEDYYKIYTYKRYLQKAMGRRNIKLYHYLSNT